MEDNKERISADDMHINVIKNDGKEVLFDSDCCSCMTLVVTSDGRLATSFFGLHTPELVNVLKKTTNDYYSKLKKEFKRQYKAEKARIKGIKLVKGQNPELNDEALINLAQELRQMQMDADMQDAVEKSEKIANGEEVHTLTKPQKAATTKKTCNCKKASTAKSKTSSTKSTSKPVAKKSSGKTNNK